MTDDDAVADMLMTWEEARERGETVTAEELCRDHPELIVSLRERIRLLERAVWIQPPAPEPLRSPRTLAGRYALEQLIGSGGYAQVWRAYDTQLHRHVAVKVPRPGRTLTADQIGEALAEARRVAKLKHPNIVTVHDVVLEGAGYFIVTELIEGRTLAERLRHGRVTVSETVRLVAQVANVIEYAHHQGIVHRDLKPANIFLDAADQPHVGDFGIARTRQELLDGSDRRGTLAYSSPEQLEGRPLDGRSDIWSLGVILYEMLAGRPPFVGDNPVRLRQSILAATVPDVPGVPAVLVAVCRRCLAVKSADRFARGHDLAVALETATSTRHSRRWLLPAALVVLAATDIAVWTFWPKPQPEPVKQAPTVSTPVETPKSPPVVAEPPRDDAFRVLRGHEGAVRSVAISADGSLTCSGGDDGKVRLWPTAGEVTVLNHDGAVTAVHMSQRGHTVLAGTAKGTVTLWGLPPRTAQERVAAKLRLMSPPLAGPWPMLANCVPVPNDPWKAQTFPAQVGGIKAVAISPDGRFVAWAGAEKLEVWAVGGNGPLTVARTPGETVHDFHFMQDGLLGMAFGFGPERKVTIRTCTVTKVNERWTATVTASGRNLELFSDVRGFVASPDRATILVTQSAAVRVFTKTIKGDGLALAGSYESPKVVLNSSISLQGNRAVTVEQDRTLRFWLLSNQSDLATFQGHDKPITAVAADGKGEVVVTASEDGTVRLWKSP